MRAILRASIAVSVAFSTSANAQGWLCVTEKTTGFYYEDKSRKWESSNFSADKKFIIRPFVNETFKWEVRELGDTGPIASAYCRDNPNDVGTMVCEGIGGTFRLNVKNGRFLHVYFLGYWTYSPNSEIFNDEGGDTPSISIGKCGAI